MSQSPSTAEDAGSLFAYRRGWSAINSLLDKGGSLSGRERHCAFLNLGDGRFADVSSSAGLDWPDDGRSLALADWDFDGRLDFFVTNRTGPRVRALLNRSQTGNGFVAVRLAGVTCNRDAIGARVVATPRGPDALPVGRTLHAGDGFLAQSSKWLHFGTGKADTLARLEVRWPDGRTDAFEDVPAGRFYLVTQGTGTIIPWDPPRPGDLEPAPLPAPPADDALRVFMPARVPLPNAEWTDLEGAVHPMVSASPDRRARLVNLWATWCAPCLAELTEWKERYAELAEAGVEVLALSIDGLDDAAGTTRADAAAFAARLDAPFMVGHAGEPVVAALEMTADALLDKHNRLPVPSTFLLDADGQVAAIYKGPADFTGLLTDIGRMGGTAVQLRDHAAHFPGRWIDAPPVASPSRLVMNFVTMGEIEDAERYLERWVRTRDPKPGRSPDIAESFYFVANTLRARGDADRAVANYRRALTFFGNQPVVHHDLGIVLADLRRHAEAVEHLAFAVDSNPRDDDTRRRLVLSLVHAGQAADAVPHLDHLVAEAPGDPTARLLHAKALKSAGRADEALAAYRRALELRPDWPLAANELAWMLATHPDDTIRDGPEAVALATLADRATQSREPAVIDTLAAAYAEAGRFDDAVAACRSGVRLARDAGRTSLERLLTERLALYESGVPFRDHPADSAGSP